MSCSVCGSALKPITSDLPFKISEQTIVIIKRLPLLQCENCPEYLIEDAIMSSVDGLLAKVGGAAELEVVPFAA